MALGGDDVIDRGGKHPEIQRHGPEGGRTERCDLPLPRFRTRPKGNH